MKERGRSLIFRYL